MYFLWNVTTQREKESQKDWTADLGLPWLTHPGLQASVSCKISSITHRVFELLLWANLSAGTEHLLLVFFKWTDTAFALTQPLSTKRQEDATWHPRAKQQAKCFRCGRLEKEDQFRGVNCWSSLEKEDTVQTENWTEKEESSRMWNIREAGDKGSPCYPEE